MISRAGFLFFDLQRLLYYPTATGCIAREVEPVLHVVDIGHEAADFEQAHHDGDVFVIEIVTIIAGAILDINIPQFCNNAEVILSVAMCDVAVGAHQLFHLSEKLGAKLGVS